MLRRIDRIAAALVFLFGLLHLAVGYRAFTDPTEPRIWFAAGGFLLVTAGLANLAAAGAGSRLQSAAAASGSLAILILGALIARGDRALLLEPQTLLLLAIGLLLTAFRLREIFQRPRDTGTVCATE
jgi:peptidoglycan/LPS O-acetylase OafA/YrhL